MWFSPWDLLRFILTTPIWEPMRLTPTTTPPKRRREWTIHIAGPDETRCRVTLLFHVDELEAVRRWVARLQRNRQIVVGDG